ncbi:MAG: PadR family transcriptional regulator [Cyclobacteriaceae bacterium]
MRFYICPVENKQLIKGSLNVIILKLLGDRERMYGYEITQYIKEMTKGEMAITEGALYPALHKLEAQGMIFSELDKFKGRTRKYYKLSEDGQKTAATQLDELLGFLNNLNLVLNAKPSHS